MNSKQNKIISYIEQLSIGSSISIRGLAKKLGVSNGTAYKAIKSAEAQGLVVTKNKAGTIRVSEGARAYKLSELVSRYNLKLVCGSELVESSITRLIPAAGSAEQLRSAIGGSGEDCLCICGDREDIMSAALESDANLLLTDGAVPSNDIISLAIRLGKYIVSTETAGHVICCSVFRSERSFVQEDVKDSVGNWMSPPVYLYKNDYISDWYRTYQNGDMNYLLQPVVNDELKICGYLPMDKALSAQISWKVTQVYEKAAYPCVVNETDSMQDAMEKMLASGSDCACVEKDGELIGLLTPGDFMRFFLYNRNMGNKLLKYQNFIDKIDSSEDGRHMTFMLHLPEALEEEDASSFVILPCMLNAAKKHFAHYFGESSVFENGTFYSEEEGRLGGEVMIGCDIKKKTKYSCVIETEMYDDIARYAAGTFVLYRNFETGRED